MENVSRNFVKADSSQPSPAAIEQSLILRMLTFAASVMLVLAFSSTASAQTGGVLSGTVHDRTGTPVPGVVLTIVDPIKGDIRVTMSDSRGAYFVDRLHYGSQYRIDASHPRFRESRVEARASEGESAVDISLVPPRSRFARVALFPLRVLSFGLIG